MARFRILGDLQVLVDERPVSLRRQKQRSLLGALLLTPGNTISIDRLAEAVWGAAVPGSARELIRLYVSQLRDLVGDAVIETHSGGYGVAADSDVDATTFRRFLERARAAHAAEDTAAALIAYREALDLWRGNVLADSPVEGAARAEGDLLEELRLAAIEEQLEIEVDARPAHELVAEIQAHVAAHPTRERLRGVLMLALYRSGRQAEALAVYRDTRRYLSEEYGIEPGEALRELERALLRQDPTLRAPLPNRPRAQARPRIALRMLTALVVAGAAAAFATLWPRANGSPRLHTRSLAVLDAGTGRLVGSVRLPAPPTAVAAGGHLVIVGSRSRSLFVVDPRRLHLVRTIALPTVPHVIAYAGATIWAGNAFDGTLTRVQVDGGVARPSRPEPRSAGRLVLSADGSTVWVGSQDNAMTQLRPSGIPIHKTRAVRPNAATVSSGSVWVAQATRVTVRRIDAVTGRTTGLVPLGTPCGAIAASDVAIWALSATGGTLWRIDPHTNAVTAAIPVDSHASGVVARGRSIWVVDGTTGVLERVEPARNTVAETIRLGYRISGATFAGGRLWVAIE